MGWFWVLPLHLPTGPDTRPPASRPRAECPSLERRSHWLGQCGAGEPQEFSRGQDRGGGTRPDSPEPGVRTVGERLVERAREAGPD